MFETVLAEELHEQFLSEIGVGGAGAFFDEESGTARSSYQRVMRDDAMEVGPETIDVRGPQTLDPFRVLSLPVLATFSGQRTVLAGRKVRCLFRIFTYRFHGIIV